MLIPNQCMASHQYITKANGLPIKRLQKYTTDSFSACAWSCFGWSFFILQAGIVHPHSPQANSKGLSLKRKNTRDIEEGIEALPCTLMGTLHRTSSISKENAHGSIEPGIHTFSHFESTTGNVNASQRKGNSYITWRSATHVLDSPCHSETSQFRFGSITGSYRLDRPKGKASKASRASKASKEIQRNLRNFEDDPV